MTLMFALRIVSITALTPYFCQEAIFEVGKAAFVLKMANNMPSKRSVRS
jgi:hypothetical protein